MKKIIDDKLLKVIEDGFNNQPCKFCGKQHHVRIEQVPSYQKTLCNQADATIPRGDMTVTISLDDGACMAAQYEITLLVSRQTAVFS